MPFLLADRADLTEASLNHPERMLVGRSSYVVADVRAGEAPLCNQTALTKARSLTPAICEVTAKLDDEPGEGDSNHEQLAIVTARAFGVCKLEVTLPELAKGRGVVLTGEVKIGREDYPGDEGAEARLAGRLAAWSRPLAAVTGAKDALALAVLAGWLLARQRRRASDEPR